MLSCFSCVQLFVTPWTVACQAPLSMGFSRQEYWSGLPCPPPGDLPYPAMELVSLMSPALSGRLLTTGTTWKSMILNTWIKLVKLDDLSDPQFLHLEDGIIIYTLQGSWEGVSIQTTWVNVWPSRVLNKHYSLSSFMSIHS